MADNVKWFKVMNEMFSDEKIEYIETLPDADAILIIWVKTLCLASKSNSAGYLMLTSEMPYTYDLLASKFKKTVKQVEYAYCLMAKLGMLIIEDNIIKISNWAKYQNIEALDSIREYNKLKKQEQRLRERVEKNNVIDKSLTSQECQGQMSNSSLISISSFNSNKEIKHLYGKFKRIKLTESEYNKLVIDFNEEYINKVIDAIDEYVESNNNKNKYSNFNLVIRKAIRDNWTCLKGITATAEVKMNKNGGYDL